MNPINKYDEPVFEQPGVDPEKILNNPKFLKFYEQFTASRGTSVENSAKDTAGMAEASKSFEQSSVVARGVRETLKNQFSKETTLAPAEAEFNPVEEYVARSAIENPGALLRLGTALEGMKTLPKEIEELGKALEKFKDVGVTDIGEAKKERETFEKGLDTTFLLTKINSLFTINSEKNAEIKERLDARREVKKKFGGLFGINAEETRKAVADLKTFEELKTFETQKKAEFTKARLAIFKEVDEVRALVDGMREKINSKLQQMAQGAWSSGKVEEFDKVWEFYRRISAGGDSGIEYLQGSMTSGPRREGFQKLTEEALSAKMLETLTSVSLESGTPLATLEKLLSKYTKKETLGMKEKEETRKFLLEALQKIREALPQDSAGRARGILLSRVIITLSAPASA